MELPPGPRISPMGGSAEMKLDVLGIGGKFQNQALRTR